MRTFITLSALAILVSGCATGENSSSYSTVVGDITIVDNGGTANTNKTANTDLSVAANKKAADKVDAKATK